VENLIAIGIGLFIVVIVTIFLSWKTPPPSTPKTTTNQEVKKQQEIVKNPYLEQTKFDIMMNPQFVTQKIESRPVLFSMAPLRQISNAEPGFFRELIELYSQQMPKSIQKLSIALKAQNEKESVLMSHDMKGSSANIGAEACRDLAAEMEKLCKERKFQETENLLKKMPGLLEETLRFIQQNFPEIYPSK